MAKTKTRTKIDASRGRAAAKASAATKKSDDPTATKNAKTGARAAQAPASSDIRQAYKKSLLGKYLDKHRGQPAIKPKK